jgi:hypothetical protein
LCSLWSTSVQLAPSAETPTTHDLGCGAVVTLDQSAFHRMAYWRYGRPLFEVVAHPAVLWMACLATPAFSDSPMQ